MTAPDPAKPALPHRARLPLAFWIMIAFGLTCILAGGVVGHYGPRLFPVKPAMPRAARLASPPRPAK